MSEDARKNLSREERLAAKLRENLRRRKAQSRATSRAAAGMEGDSQTAESLPNRPAES
jgi:hypothetical protein